MSRMAVLERDLEIVGLLHETLRPDGWEIMLYHDRRHLIDAAHSDKPDLILLDVAPDRPATGWDVLALLKADGVTIAMPVIVSSRDVHDLLHHQHYLERSGACVLVRPCSADDIRQCVHAALRNATAIT